jgi:hypothetical protein
MDWDTTTQTGARNSGAEVPTSSNGSASLNHRPDTERGTRMRPRSARGTKSLRTVDRGGGGNGGMIRSRFAPPPYPIKKTKLKTR